jgi:hypothetical protein
VARPTIQVRVAFSAGPYDTISSLVWTDITAYVRDESIAIRRGRSDERSPYESGTLTLTLDNRDRRFEPSNEDSPYWPNVLPNRWVNIRAQWNSVWYDLYTGYVTSWKQQYDYAFDATVVLEAADAFRLFNLERRTDTVSGTVTDYSVLTLLCIKISWPSGNRNFDSINDRSQIGDYAITNGNVLEAMRSVADGTLGSLFMDVDGQLRWQSRFYRARTNTPLAVFGDASVAQNSNAWILGSLGLGLLGQTTVLRGALTWLPELPYRDVSFDYSERTLFNHIQVSRIGGVVQEEENAASIATYRRRTLQRLNLNLLNDTDADAQAQYLLQQYATPVVRPSSVTITPLATDLLWEPVLSLNLNQRIRVLKRPGGGAPIVKDARIEGIEHRFTKHGDWETTYRLSPATGGDYWALDTSALDSGTILTYY